MRDRRFQRIVPGAPVGLGSSLPTLRRSKRSQYVKDRFLRTRLSAFDRSAFAGVVGVLSKRRANLRTRTNAEFLAPVWEIRIPQDVRCVACGELIFEEGREFAGSRFHI